MARKDLFITVNEKRPRIYLDTIEGLWHFILSACREWLCILELPLLRQYESELMNITPECPGDEELRQRPSSAQDQSRKRPSMYFIA